MTAETADIGEVERETGLSKDTLRVWERRYGFPRPLRDVNGERSYPADQVTRLRMLRRLMDQGLRPGSIVGASEAELATRMEKRPGTGERTRATSRGLRELAVLLEKRRLDALHTRLATLLVQLGVQRFVPEIAAPLTVTVGELWAAGRIAIADEHRYSELLQQLLRTSIPPYQALGQRPRILLTTVPGEPHALGLLMVHAWLAAERVVCISLGTQTPATEIATAAVAYHVDIVGLSFSPLRPASAARRDLVTLRACLKPSIDIWAGGSLWRNVRKRSPGAQYVVDFAELSEALKAWSH